MPDDAMRGSEINDYVDVAQFVLCEGCASGVFCGPGDENVMSAAAGDFRYQRSGFSTA